MEPGRSTAAHGDRRSPPGRDAGTGEAQSAPKNVSSLILKIESVTELLKGSKGLETIEVTFDDVSTAGLAVKLRLGAKTLENVGIDSEPVKWRAVLPNGNWNPETDEGPRHQVGLDATYIATFAKALKVLDGLTGGMALTLYGPARTVVVRFARVPDFRDRDAAAGVDTTGGTVVARAPGRGAAGEEACQAVAR